MMQVMIRCDSLLLEKSLEIYLEEYIVSSDKAFIYVSDRDITLDKPIFLIGHSQKADLKVPFTKDQLLSSLYKYYLALRQNDSKQNEKPIYVKF